MKASTTLFLMLVLFSCMRDDSHLQFQLPAKSQKGANTFGFLLDGKVWRNYGERCTWAGCDENLDSYYYKSDTSMRMQADRVLYKSGEMYAESFHIYLEHMELGRNTYSSGRGDNISVVYYPPNESLTHYILSATNPQFTIKFTRLDTAQGIMAGQFYGALFLRTWDGELSTSPTDGLYIADGRFDLKYK